MNLAEKDKKYLGRSGFLRDLEVTKADGSYIYDQNGKKYIDFFMGWCVGNSGWNLKEAKARVRKFKGPDYVSPGFLYKPWVELAELLARITPGKLMKSYRATGGTEAVEIALQAAMSFTKRKKFISIEGSYHGHSIGALSVGGSEFRGWYSNLLPDCKKITRPLNEEAGRKVEKLLSKRDIAAFISEPIICNLGVIIPDKKFFKVVQAACKKYGTLFIADEVATGFGRTGKMFACEHYGVKPDIMCVAKGLTGGYGALGATIMTEEVAKSFEFGFSFYSTFGWLPLNVEGTLANLNYLIKNKSALLKNANELSKYFQKRLEKMKFRYSPRIRIKGLAIGVEFDDPTYASKIVDSALENGLLLATGGSTDFVIFPALNIPRSLVKRGLDILENCL